jgi:hypothetical protein
MTEPPSEILVPDIAAWPRQLAETDQKVTGLNAGARPGGRSLIVDRLPAARTVQRHGLSGPELDRLAGAVHFMELHCHRRGCRLWWLTTDRGTARTIIADIGKRITRLQHEYDLRAYTATVFETRGGLHAHIAFIGCADIDRRLKSSAAFGSIIKIEPVTDPGGLVRRYLAKERTPQAGYGRNHLLGGRLRGSHRLVGGGDRVRLSEGLKRDAIAAKYVEPWTQTNARRGTERKTYRLRRLNPRKAPKLGGQIMLPLAEIMRPVSRLRQFGGGPAAVACEIEFRRRQRGLSQSQLGSLIGRSQGQIANALRGHDPISGTAVHRLRDILLA